MPSLQFARTASLSLTNALAVVAGSVGLNALIKSNQIQTKLHHAAPPGTLLIINIHDTLRSGITSTSISAAISVATFLFLSFNIFAPRLTEGRALRIQGAILAFFALWLFAAETAFTVFFATRQAKVSASLGGVAIPQNVIAGVEKSLGATRIYKDIWYRESTQFIPDTPRC
jgi:hypothetical protein